MAQPETSKYYDCDPFIPGAFPEDALEADSRRPLRHFVSTLTGNLINTNGQLIAPVGAPVIELGFVSSLRPGNRDQLHIRRVLGDAGAPLRLARMALEDSVGVTKFMDAEDLAFLRAPFQEQGALPSTIVAHTRPDVAEIAVTDFGFEYAGASDCVPEQRARAIQELEHTPVTIFMPMDQFLAIEAA